MEKLKKGLKVPMIVIIIAFVVFWPVGIVLLILRLASNRSDTFKPGTPKTLTTVSWVLFGIAVLLTGTGLSELSYTYLAFDYFFFAALFCVGGLLTNRYALYMKRNAVLYRRYIECIVNRQMTNLDDIAREAGVTRIRLINGLRRMINIGYLPGAQLDVERNVIYITLHGFAPEGHDMYNYAAQVPYATKCESCGANGTIIPGQINVCEYCDSPLG